MRRKIRSGITPGAYVLVEAPRGQGGLARAILHSGDEVLSSVKFLSRGVPWAGGGICYVKTYSIHPLHYVPTQDDVAWHEYVVPGGRSR